MRNHVILLVLVASIILYNTPLESPTGHFFLPTANIATCPANITESSNLTQNAASNGTCATIATDNIIFDCLGFSLTGNTTGNGIDIVNSTNVTIQHCIISNFTIAINASNSTNLTLHNVTITNSTTGITLNTTTSTITNSTLTADTALNLTNSTNSTFTTITLTSTTWMTLDPASTNNTLANGTFTTSFGSIHFTPQIALPAGTTINRSGINVSLNNTFVNSTLFPSFNTSARNTLTNLTLLGPELTVDFSDNSTYVGCPTSVCTFVSYAGGTLIFDVTNFTTYRAQEFCPKTITQDTNLTNNISTIGGCITIGADNVTLDCQGFTINSSNTTAEGVSALSRNNVTVKNCNIIGFRDGIRYNTITNSSIINNTVRQSADQAIEVLIANNTLVTNNTGSGDDNGYRTSSTINNTVTNNSFTATASFGIGYTGTGVQNSTFTGNTFNASFGGLSITSGSNTQLINTTVFTSQQLASFFTATNWTIINFTSYGGTALTLSSMKNSSFSTISLFGNNTLISFESATTDNAFDNLTLETNTTWIKTAAASIGNNISNTTFQTPFGSIFMASVIELPNATTINTTNLNISANNSLLNSTAHPFLNVTANITLINITFSNPRILVDELDNGTFAPCSSATCTIISHSNNVLVFTVQHFTSYAAGETPSTPSGSTSSGGGGSSSSAEPLCIEPYCGTALVQTPSFPEKDYIEHPTPQPAKPTTQTTQEQLAAPPSTTATTPAAAPQATRITTTHLTVAYYVFAILVLLALFAYAYHKYLRHIE